GRRAGTRHREDARGRPVLHRGPHPDLGRLDGARRRRAQDPGRARQPLRRRSARLWRRNGRAREDSRAARSRPALRQDALMLGIAVLLGWQFVVGAFVGGPLMIALVAIAFRRFLTQRLVGEARAEAEKGRLGSMEGHAEMDMSAEGEGSWRRRLRSPAGLTAT